MALAASQLAFIGPVPVDRNTAERTLTSEYHIPATAAGTDFEIPLFWADSRNPVLSVKSAYFTPSADIAKSTSLYLTFSLTNRGAAGAGTDVIASFTSNAASGNVSKYVRQAFTVDATKVINPGDLITLNITHASTGTAIPLGKLELTLSQ